jgi:hypothetical protein
VIGLASDRVSPFGHPGINACVPLPLAYRSLPRPSSPPCAQAFPTCLRSLDYKAVCVKQSTRDLTDRTHARSSSDNPYEIESLSTKIHKSAIYHSSVVKQHRRAGSGGRPESRRHSTEQLNLGMDVEACDLRDSFSHDPAVDLLEISVKEVIQPQVPLRLPCYDFAPVTALAFGRLVPCGF